MVQTLVPIQTMNAGSWIAVGAASLHLCCDETIAALNAADYANSLTSGDTCQLKCGPGIDPGTHTGWKIRCQLFRGAASAVDLTVDLLQGATVIATTVFALNNASTLHEYTLSSAEAAAVRDFSDLRLRYTRSATTTGSRILACEIQLPDVAPFSDVPGETGLGAASPTVSAPAVDVAAGTGSASPRALIGLADVGAGAASASPSVLASAVGSAAEFATSAVLMMVSAVGVASSLGSAACVLGVAATALAVGTGSSAPRVQVSATGVGTGSGLAEQFDQVYVSSYGRAVSTGSALAGYRAKHVDLNYQVPGQPSHYKHRCDVHYLPAFDPGAFPELRPQLLVFLAAGFSSSDQWRDHVITPANGLAWRMMLKGWVIVPATFTVTGITEEDPAINPSSPTVPGKGLFYPPVGATAALWNSVENGGIYAIQEKDALIFTQFVHGLAGSGQILQGVIDTDNSWGTGRSNGGMLASYAAFSIDKSGKDGFGHTSSRLRGVVIEAVAGAWFLAYLQDGTVPANHFAANGNVDVTNPAQPVATTLSQVPGAYQTHVSFLRYAADTTNYPELLDATGANRNRLSAVHMTTAGNWEQYDFNDSLNTGGYSGSGLPSNVLADIHSGTNPQLIRQLLKEMGVPFGPTGKRSRLVAPPATANAQAEIDLMIAAGDSSISDPQVQDRAAWLHQMAFTGWYEAASNTMLGRFATLVAGPLSLPTQYDNMPAPTTNEVTWAEAGVTFGEAEQVETGRGVGIRRSGELLVSVYTPLEQGDGAVWAIIDAIEAAFVAPTRVDGLTFQPTNARRAGQVQTGDDGGAFWRTDISVPFWGDQLLPIGAYASAPTAGHQNLAGITSTIRERFEVRIVQAEGVRANYDNTPITPLSSERWISLNALPAAARQMTTGQTGTHLFERRGVAKAQVFIPIGQGTQEALYLADRIDQFFRTVSDDGVEFSVPQVLPIGRSGAFWQVNVTCPWRAFSYA